LFNFFKNRWQDKTDSGEIKRLQNKTFTITPVSTEGTAVYHLAPLGNVNRRSQLSLDLQPIINSQKTTTTIAEYSLC
jgi:hypothetical protein